MNVDNSIIDDDVVISLRKYALDIFTKTSMLDCHPSDTDADPDIKLLLDLETVIQYVKCNFLLRRHVMDGGLDNVAEVCRHLVDCRFFLSIVRMISECVSHCTNENTMDLDLFFLILTISSLLVSTLCIVEMSHHCCSRVFIFKHLIGSAFYAICCCKKSNSGLEC